MERFIAKLPLSKSHWLKLIKRYGQLIGKKDKIPHGNRNDWNTWGRVLGDASSWDNQRIDTHLEEWACLELPLSPSQCEIIWHLKVILNLNVYVYFPYPVNIRWAQQILTKSDILPEDCQTRLSPAPTFFDSSWIYQIYLCKICQERQGQ